MSERRTTNVAAQIEYVGSSNERRVTSVGVMVEWASPPAPQVGQPGQPRPTAQPAAVTPAGRAIHALAARIAPTGRVEIARIQRRVQIFKSPVTGRAVPSVSVGPIGGTRKMRLPELLKKIKPFVVGWVAAESTNTITSQTTGFLKTDGTRQLLGDLSTSDGVTIDGVDIDGDHKLDLIGW